MNDQYDVIIIGSGIGALTTGNLLAKHGKRVLMLEQHSIAGGYCTSYERRGCIFDVPVAMTNMRKGDAIERLFTYIGVNKTLEFIEIDKLARIVGPDITFEWYTDTYKLEYELISKFPHEEQALKRYFKTLRDLWEEMDNAHYNPTLLQMLTYPVLFPKLVKYNNDTFEQFANRFFKDEKLKELLGKEAITLGLAEDKISALYYIGMIMAYAQGGIWYPKGGFQKMSDAFVDCFREAGGELRLKSRVKKIIVENRKATGVELDTGEKFHAPIVISNADTKKTFLELIDSGHLKKKFTQKIQNLTQSYSGFVVKLGVKMPIDELKNYAWFFHFPEYGSSKKMLDLADRDKIDIDNCSFSIETAALMVDESETKGVNVISLVVLPVSYRAMDTWRSADKEQYNALKEELADKLIKKAEAHIPDLSRNIVVRDICTPLSYERYTSATNGGWYDIAATPAQSLTNKLGPKTPIKGLYLTGAKSILGAGLVGAIFAGLNTADTLMKGQLTNGKSYLKPELLKVKS
ncbi:phytoene desaturase family protein [Candidatus Latescibacterota bacterium]